MLDMWQRFSQIHIYTVFIIDNATPSIVGYSSFNGAPSRIKASGVPFYISQVNAWWGGEKNTFHMSVWRSFCICAWQRNKNKSMNCHPEAALVSVLVQRWETRHLSDSNAYKAILSSDSLKRRSMLMLNPLFDLGIVFKACFAFRHHNL